MVDNAHISGGEPGGTTMLKGKGEHILLVDDALHVGAEKQLIEQLNYRVTACTSSTEALALLHSVSVQIHCVISNLIMPRVGGLDLANTCRLCRPGTPFYLMCDDARALPLYFPRTHAVSDFILKPLSARVLAETLHRVLGGRKV